jgi:protein translocase SecG subunit
MMFLQILFLVIAVFLTFIVVIQPSKGEGLGSVGGGGQMFFSKNKSFEALMEKITTGTAVAFMLLAVILGAIF